MPSLLRDRPASSAEMLAVFDDAALLRAALDFEAALARAEAAEHIIPPAAAEAIARVCASADFDVPMLADAAAHAGALAIPLVELLRARVAEIDGGAADFVHFASTSQDVADTALMLQARAGAALIRRDGEALADALAALAERHAETPMLARTLMQGALPITFGLRVANWLLGVDGALARFEREAVLAIRLQLGGPAGSLGELTAAVVERVAADLQLPAPLLPWHARREALAGLASALAIVTGAVGKIARDVALMAQNEVGEALEPRVAGRGGSSAMAGKRNPTGCQVALSAAARAPGLCAGILTALPQEQERGLGGWQADAPALTALFELTHGALKAMRPVIEDLEVDRDAMARNLEHAARGRAGQRAGDLVRLALSDRRKSAR